MAYKGQARIVSCSQGGLTGANNIDAISPFMMIYPSRNLVYEKAGRRKRGGTAYVNEAAYTGTPKLLGIYDCIFESLTQYVLVATDDGDIYKDASNKIATSLGTTLPYSFAMGENKVFIADGVSTPQIWSGSGNTTNITEAAASWAASPPFQFLLHTRGGSQRMCALNKDNLFLSKPYSSAGDMEYFTTSALSFYRNTGDGYGLVGMAQIGDEVVVFGKKKAYRLDDSDTDSGNWGFYPAQWDGGVAAWRCIVKVPSGDCVCMTDDGEIYSVMAATTYGDYQRASLTRDSWMHDYIKEYINLAQAANFHAVYDPVMRAVVFFVASDGSTNNDTALLYFIDRAAPEAWMVHDNQAYDSGYDACSSAIIKDKTAGSYKTYTGNYVGVLWKLNQSSRHDNSNGYYAGWTTPNDAFDNPRGQKLFNRIHLIGSANGDVNMTVVPYVDSAAKSPFDISISGGGNAYLDSFTLDTDELSDYKIVDEANALGYRGKRIQYVIYNDDANEDFFITEYMTDYKPVGNQQEE